MARTEGREGPRPTHRISSWCGQLSFLHPGGLPERLLPARPPDEPIEMRDRIPPEEEAYACRDNDPDQDGQTHPERSLTGLEPDP